MVGALGPAGRGAESGMSRTIAIHGFAIVLGATLMGLVVATVGSFVQGSPLASVLSAALVACLMLVALQAIDLRTPPQSRWQVPEPWRRLLDMEVLAGFYGFVLGFGVFTAVVLSAFWVFVTLTLAAAPGVAVAAWASYGLARTLSFGIAITANRGKPPFLSSRARQSMIYISLVVSALAAVASLERFPAPPYL